MVIVRYAHRRKGKRATNNNDSNHQIRMTNDEMMASPRLARRSPAKVGDSLNRYIGFTLQRCNGSSLNVEEPMPNARSCWSDIWPSMSLEAATEP